MAVIYNSNSSTAPAGLKLGDTFTNKTDTYTITKPGTPGANYNPASGYWSIGNKSIVGQIGRSNQNTNDIMQNASKVANSVSAESSAKQYEYNSREAEKTRQWQEMMSNTAHQREVQDLIKAGLNPVLSINGGNGSSTPSGATASGSNYQGQKSDTESVSGVLATILGTMLNNDTQRDIAQITKDAMIQGASISSAASIYGANKSAYANMYSSDNAYKLGIETRNPFNRLGNEALNGGNNSGLVVSRLKNMSDWIYNKIGGMMDSQDRALRNLKNPLKK